MALPVRRCCYSLTIRSIIRTYSTKQPKNPDRLPAWLVKNSLVRDVFNQYENLLKKYVPTVYKLHRIVIDGGTHSVKDLKTYFRVWREIRAGKTLNQLSRVELEVYLMAPYEFKKIAAIAVLITLPMTVLLIGVAFVLMPRLLLTRHFWSHEQRFLFSEKYLQERQRSFCAVMLHTAKFGKVFPSDTFMDQLRRNTPTVQSLKYLASFDRPLNLPSLDEFTFGHLYQLGRCYGLMPFGLAAHLKKRAELVVAIDKKLLSELRHDDKSFSLGQLRFECFLRQLRCGNATEKDLISILKEWCVLTEKLSGRNGAIENILYAPILAQLNLAPDKAGIMYSIFSK